MYSVGGALDSIEKNRTTVGVGSLINGVLEGINIKFYHPEYLYTLFPESREDIYNTPQKLF